MSANRNQANMDTRIHGVGVDSDNNDNGRPAEAAAEAEAAHNIPVVPGHSR